MMLLKYAKLLPGILILLLCAALAWNINQLSHTKKALNNERVQRREVADLLGAQDNWVSMRTHSRDLVMSNFNLSKALEDISKKTLEAKKRADAADAALLREQAENAKRFAQAQKTITNLQNQKTTGDKNLDDQLIDQFSKLPWLGWRAPAQANQWENSEQRADYNHMGNKLMYRQRPVELVLHPSRVALEQTYVDNKYVTRKYLSSNNIEILAYSEIETNDGVCRIHIVDPKNHWNSEARQTMGHELAHCFYGYWHGEI